MYGNVDTALLWLRLLEKYLVNDCNLKRIKADSCILFRKFQKRMLELVMSFHVDDVFIAGKPEIPKVIKEQIKEKFKISDSIKLGKFLGVYYEWGHNVKGMYAKITMERT